jgi:hypothetical protein
MKRRRQIIIRVRQLAEKRWYVSIAEVENAAIPAISKALPNVSKLRIAKKQATDLAEQYRVDGCDVVLDNRAYRVDRRRAERARA